MERFVQIGVARRLDRRDRRLAAVRVQIADDQHVRIDLLQLRDPRVDEVAGRPGARVVPRGLTVERVRIRPRRTVRSFGLQMIHDDGKHGASGCGCPAPMTSSVCAIAGRLRCRPVLFRWVNSGADRITGAATGNIVAPL